MLSLNLYISFELTIFPKFKLLVHFINSHFSLIINSNFLLKVLKNLLQSFFSYLFQVFSNNIVHYNYMKKYCKI